MRPLVVVTRKGDTYGRRYLAIISSFPELRKRGSDVVVSTFREFSKRGGSHPGGEESGEYDRFAEVSNTMNPTGAARRAIIKKIYN
jgi:hypothetical protein